MQSSSHGRSDEITTEDMLGSFSLKNLRNIAVEIQFKSSRYKERL